MGIGMVDLDFRELAKVACYFLVIIAGLASGVYTYFSSGILLGVVVGLAVIVIGAILAYILFEHLIPE